MLHTPTSTIRPATRAEIPAVSGVIAKALETFRGVLNDETLDEYIKRSSDVAGRWDRGDVLVIESMGRIAGSVTYVGHRRKTGDNFPVDWATFRTLAVDPAARGRGLGRALVAHCIARARDEGASAVGIHTAGFMATAEHMYRRAGFVRCPHYDMYYFDPAAGGVRVLGYRFDPIITNRKI